MFLDHGFDLFQIFHLRAIQKNGNLNKGKEKKKGKRNKRKKRKRKKEKEKSYLTFLCHQGSKAQLNLRGKIPFQNCHQE